VVGWFAELCRKVKLAERHRCRDNDLRGGERNARNRAMDNQHREIDFCSIVPRTDMAMSLLLGGIVIAPPILVIVLKSQSGASWREILLVCGIMVGIVVAAFVLVNVLMWNPLARKYPPKPTLDGAVKNPNREAVLETAPPIGHTIRQRVAAGPFICTALNTSEALCDITIMERGRLCLSFGIG
jgi:hypothetical protein